MNGVHSTSTGTRLLFADSTNRDVQLYPSGNSYVLHLTSPVKNVERVDLVSARVPNTMYNLSDGYNVISVNSSNVSLNPGFYSVYGLAQALTGAITNVIVEYPMRKDGTPYIYGLDYGKFTPYLKPSRLVSLPSRLKTLKSTPV